MGRCSTCDNDAEHYIEYVKLSEPVNWTGVYCDACFVRKLRGMANAWD